MPKYNPNKKRPTKGDIKRELIATSVVQGKGVTEIAKELGLTANTVSNYINKDEKCMNLIISKFNNVIEEGNNKIRQHYLQQIDTLIEIADTSDDKTLQFRAATYLIEMLNGKPVAKKVVDADVNVKETIIEVTIDDIIDGDFKEVDNDESNE